MNQPDAPIQPKQHFEILDGLRGVAAMMVVIFHMCEAWNGGDHARQIVNHGYLAVDFFFLLSGFVIAYAYDDRWHPTNGKGRMTVWDFFKRRLIRLQPMVVLGTTFGALLFYQGASPKIFPLIAGTSMSRLILIALIGCTLIPIPVSMDIRGWQEMHPLDSAAWSLLFEYIANIAYALGLRKASKRVLLVLTALSAALLTHYLLTTPRGDITGGWTLNVLELKIGFLRLCFPFLAGMLLQRMHKRLYVRNAFLWSSLLLVLSFILPRFGTPATGWKNGLYEASVVILLNPVIVAMGAGEQISGRVTERVCRFFRGHLLPALPHALRPDLHLHSPGCRWNAHPGAGPGMGCGAVLYCHCCRLCVPQALRRAGAPLAEPPLPGHRHHDAVDLSSTQAVCITRASRRHEHR